MKKIILFCILLMIARWICAQVYKDPNASVDARVESVLSYMTLDEKLSYIGGINNMYIMAISRFNLPEIKMSDGPVGVRTWGQSTAYPAGICSAATWDRVLVNRLGQALGKDARARGVHILLGPGLNIYRAPMCGRNFEYFGEDPFLASAMSYEYVTGVQSEHVVSTVKHFAGNNQEWDRYNVSSDIDERTLQEIYLPAFKSAVIRANAGAVMNAYNLFNGIHCTQNVHLNLDILKNQWKFQGILMSDWGATHDGVAAANGGLDLEMPGGNNMNYNNLSTPVAQGIVLLSTIDDKVRRILRMIFSYGFYDKVQTDISIPLDNPDNDSVSLNLAREGIVLLKNDSILPLHTDQIKSLALLGPNADGYIAGGGSSYTDPFHYISVRQGISQLEGSKITLNYVGAPDIYSLADTSLFYTSSGSQTRGLIGNYFASQDLSGSPVATRIDSIIDFHWSGVPNVSGMPADHFSIRWTGVMRPSASGNYSFYVRGDDGFRLYVNNVLIIDNWVDEAATIKTGTINLTAGQEYPIKLEYYENAGLAEITLGYVNQSDIQKKSLQVAGSSDAAIVCVGFNSASEQEGMDRSFNLDPDQDSLICNVAKVNKNTIVVLNAGGNIDMQAWLPKIRGLIHAWYPGQDGGKAIAEILFGVTNPSGKLPASFEKKWADNPVYNNYYQNNGSNHVKYNEGVFLGYRYYETYHIAPQYPFGYGLSYTTFTYSNMTFSVDTSGHTLVSFEIQNTGSVAGAEVAQVYISPVAPKIPRPVKELKEFSRVFLQPGEKQTITLKLDESAFAYFSVDKNAFVADSGDYDVIIGASAEDERLRDRLTISQDSVIAGSPKLIAPSECCSIYPNPACDKLFIQMHTTNLNPSAFYTYSSSGQLLYSGKFTGQSCLYNCSHLPEGMYICRINRYPFFARCTARPCLIGALAFKSC